jgi:hypothetical protein
MEKRPPVKKTFRIKPRKITSINPIVSTGIITPIPVIRSVITSIFMVSAKSSVTMLEPSILFIPDFTGRASKLIRKSIDNHINRTPFHALSERTAPDFK